MAAGVARRTPTPAVALAGGPGRGAAGPGIRWVKGGRTGAETPTAAPGVGVRPTGGANGARGPVAGSAPDSLGIGRTGLATAVALGAGDSDAAPGARDTARDAGKAGRAGLTDAAVASGRPGIRRGPAGAGRAAGGAATPVTAAGLAALLSAAPAAGRCNGGRNACIGGRNGVPLPAPITMEGREAAVGITFSGSGPRGRTCDSPVSTACECGASSGTASSGAASCSLTRERTFALTLSAISTSIELE